MNQDMRDYLKVCVQSWKRETRLLQSMRAAGFRRVCNMDGWEENAPIDLCIATCLHNACRYEARRVQMVKAQ